MQTITTETLKLNRYRLIVKVYAANGEFTTESMNLAAVNSVDAAQYGYRMLDQSVRARCAVTVTVQNASKVWISDNHFRPTVQAS